MHQLHAFNVIRLQCFSGSEFNLLVTLCISICRIACTALSCNYAMTLTGHGSILQLKPMEFPFPAVFLAQMLIQSH